MNNHEMNLTVTEIREWFINEISERVDNSGLANIIAEHNDMLMSFNETMKKLKNELAKQIEQVVGLIGIAERNKKGDHDATVVYLHQLKNDLEKLSLEMNIE